MNITSFKLISFLLSIAALTVASTPMSAHAEVPNTDSSLQHSESVSASIQAVEPIATSASTVDSQATNYTRSLKGFESATAPTQGIEPVATTVPSVDQLENTLIPTAVPDNTVGQRPVQPAKLADNSPYQTDSQSRQPKALGNEPKTSWDRAKDVTATQPTPEKLETSATYLTGQSPTAPMPSASSVSATSSQNSDSTVAQNVDIEPGRATRGGSSYIGIGGNIGLGGNPSLGDGSFVINSKIGLTRNISFRPAALIGDDTDFLIPITYDFVIQSADPFAPVPFAPFLGGGAIISTNGDNNIGFLLTGGVDVPLSRQLVANGSINVGFRNDTDVGIILGVGYSFVGF